MEYDNDRPIKPAYRIEIFYWILLGAMSPLINCLYLFWGDIRMWPVLFIINLVLLPAYLFYSGTIVPKFLFQPRYGVFIVTSILFFGAILLLLYGVYSIV